jgi:hypothetical protein
MSDMHQSYKRLLLALSLLMLPLIVKADLLSHGFTVTYEVSRNGIYLGDTVRTFKQLPDGNWQYTSTTNAKGLAGLFFHDTVQETSIVKQQGNHIIPLSYVYDQTGGKDVERYRIDFLWDKHTIHNSRQNKDYKIEGNAQDVQTFLLQLMRDLQNHQNTVTYFIASRSNATAYVLTQNGSQKIETPYKTLETIELSSNKLKDNDQYRVWCAVALEFMPVKVLKIDSDDNKIEFVIKDLKLQ